MPAATTSIQFYVFDNRHFAIPLENLSEPGDYAFWNPALALISRLTGNRIVMGKRPEWISQLEFAKDWLVLDNVAESPRIIVLLASMQDIHQQATYRNICKIPEDGLPALRAVLSEQEPFIESRLLLNRPVIMVGTEDMMGLYEERTLEAAKERAYLYSLDPDSRFKFWDSGIWHRYVPLDSQEDNTAEPHFGIRFQAVYKQMNRWYEDGLYSTFVALENIEFQTRLMLDSFIAEVGHHGHQERVTPFKFHSETQMERRCEQLIASLKAQPDGFDLLETVKWRLLLIDDHGEESRPLAGYHSRTNGLGICRISKKQLIQQLIQAQIPDQVFEIESAEEGTEGYIDSALKLLQKKTYDIILLDYLLGNGMRERNGREYGYDFLSKLDHSFNWHEHPNGEQVLHKGPLGRFWIFPISSFPFAFSDKLRQLGMDGYSDHWHLAGGGDPVCTPALFRYNFLNFIKQQIKECYLDQSGLRDFVNRFSNVKSPYLWQKLLEKNLERFKLKDEVLKNDKTQGSLFAETMLDYKEKDVSTQEQFEELRSLVENLDTSSYYINKVLLSNFKDPFLQVRLEEKSRLYFKAEQRFIEKINHHLLSPSDEFEFEFEGLHWVPEEVEQLHHIKILRLSHNELASLPPTLKKLQELKELHLQFNKFTELPDWLAELPKLQLLDLSGNHLLPKELSLPMKGHDIKARIYTQNGIIPAIVEGKSYPKKQIGILYNHRDADGLSELEVFLSPMSYRFEFLIPGKAGAYTHEEFLDIIYKADIILVLLSQDFFGPTEKYLSVASEQRRTIVPIHWRNCNNSIDLHPILKGLTTIPPPTEAIKYSGNRDKLWDQVARHLRSLDTFD